MAEETLAVEPAITEKEVADAKEAEAKLVAEIDAESVPAAAETSEVKEKEKDPIQDRFDKLTRDKYDALREADYWRDRANKPEPSAAKPEPVAPAAPTLESVGYDEAKYQAALIKFARDEARDEARAILETERTQRESAERQAKFNTRQTEFIVLHPDYVEKVQQNRTLPIDAEMGQLIMASDVGPAVAYYLADNLDKARAISTLPLIEKAREIGRIEARLEVKKTPAVVPLSKAPAPPPKIEAANPAITKEVKDMTDAEFAKWRHRQIAQRR